MIRLLYLSQATHDISDVQVQDILRSARRNNEAVGITGVLVHGGSMFAQILEGPEQAVLRMYVKVMDDRRHGDVRIIHISPANEPMFKDWSMAVIKSNPMEFQHIAQLRTHRMEAVHAQAFGETMREFVAILNAQRASA
ncbi:MAG: BLUF domain-containing protein [Rhodoferax sp.]|nr:BLUF domain-containing protein [Rhodoferax sp.]